MTEQMKTRGPVCECDDPRCFASLQITWEQWEAIRLQDSSPQIAATCESEVAR